MNKKYFLILIINLFILSSCSSFNRPKNLNKDTIYYYEDKYITLDYIFNSSEEIIYKKIDNYNEFKSIYNRLNNHENLIKGEESKLTISKDSFVSNSFISLVIFETRHSSYPLYYSSHELNSSLLALNFYQYNPYIDKNGTSGELLPYHYYFILKIDDIELKNIKKVKINLCIEDLTNEYKEKVFDL